MATAGSTQKLVKEHGNQFTVWEVIQEDSLQVTLLVTDSMGLVGRELVVSIADFKKRFHEVPRG